jgi:hypothetical protein
VFTETSTAEIMTLRYSTSNSGILSFLCQLLEGCKKSIVQRYNINSPHFYIIYCKKQKYQFEFEVLVLVTVRSTICRDTTVHNPVECHRCFWGIYSLHLQDVTVRPLRKQLSVALLVPASCQLLALLLDSENGGSEFLRNVGEV